MNREIKFRIWADNKFYNKCLVGNTNNTNDEKWTCPMVWLEKQKEWVHCDNGIICQYTGLHDKDGQEIYEGDIVKVWHINQYLYGIVQWSITFNGYFIMTPFAGYKPIENGQNVEIVGDIHHDLDIYSDLKLMMEN